MRFLCLLACVAGICAAQTYTIETIAGNGAPGFSGDNSLSSRAQLNEPAGVVPDTSGRLYIADRGNNRIRRIELNGFVRTIASFDDGTISGITIDSAGTLYVARGAVIYSIPAAGGDPGVFAAPDGVTGITAMAAEATAGSLLVADSDKLLRVSATSVTPVATLPGTITGLAIGPGGSVYAVAGESVYTVDGSGAVTPLANAPQVTAGARIAVDRWGDVYLSGSTIQKIAAGRSWILAGTDTAGYGGDGGPATFAQINGATGIAVDTVGNVYFADTLNHRVRMLRAPLPAAIIAAVPSDRALEIWPKNVVLRWVLLTTPAPYEVYFGRSADSLAKVGTSSNGTWALDSLADRTTYYWRVRTQLAPLPPVESSIFSFTTTAASAQPPPVPDAPGPANFAVGQPSSVVLNWRGGNASRYEVFLGEEVSTPGRVGITTEPRLTLGGLKPDTQYYWRVVAINDSGQSVSPLWRFSTGPANGYPYIIEALGGAPVKSADGSASTETILKLPRSPVADSTGNIYFIDADKSLRRSGVDRKISTLFTVASGTMTSLTTDILGNVYFSTPEYIVRITRTGARSFVAGQVSRRGYAGDGGAASAALLDGISSIAADRRGNIYIADTNNNRVRVISSSGQMQTFAGDGTCGKTDGTGRATGIPVCAPTQVATDSAGGVYIYASGLLLKVTNGTAERISGNGTPGNAGDDGPAADALIGPLSGLVVDAGGSIYALDSRSMTVRRIGGDGIITTIAGDRDSLGRASGFAGDGLPATWARFGSPAGLAFDALGNLLIGDTWNHRIRSIDAAGFTSTVAGADTVGVERGSALTAYIYGPTSLQVDGGGNIYVADTLNQRIRRISPGRVIDTVAGGGTEPVSGPGIIGRNGRDLKLDPAPNMVLGMNEAGNPVFSTAANALITLSPNGTVSAYMPTPAIRIGGIARGLAGDLYVSDTAGNRIYRIDRDGTSSIVAGTGIAGFDGDGGPALLAQVNAPGAMTLSPSGEIYVAEVGRIRRIASDGRIVTVAFENAKGLVVDRNGVLYVAGDRSVYRTSPDPRQPGNLVFSRIAGRESGTPVTAPAAALDARIGEARGLGITAEGDLVFADASENAVRRLILNRPVALTIVSGDQQTLSENYSLKAPMRVKVVGSGDVPLPGIMVRFTYTSGTQTAVLGTVATGNDGTAAIYATFGPRTGGVTVEASALGLTPVVFTILGR